MTSHLGTPAPPTTCQDPDHGPALTQQPHPATPVAKGGLLPLQQQVPLRQSLRLRPPRCAHQQSSSLQLLYLLVPETTEMTATAVTTRAPPAHDIKAFLLGETGVTKTETATETETVSRDEVEKMTGGDAEREEMEETAAWTVTLPAGHPLDTQRRNTC